MDIEEFLVSDSSEAAIRAYRDVENFLASFGYAKMTKDSYRRVLISLISLDKDLAKIEAAELIRFVSKEQWGANTRHTALCACRKYLRWKYGAGHPALSAQLKLPKPKTQRVLSIEMATKLLAMFDRSTPKGARDLALAALALDSGLRVSELARLTIQDTNLQTRRLQVIVKGGQWGTAIFSEQTTQYISDWLVFRKSSRSNLFVNTRTGEPLTREGIKVIVRNWGLSLGIKLSPHDFRRSFATLSTIFGAPSRIVQEAGRWSSIDMVEHYTRNLDADKITPYLPLTNLGKT